MDIIITRNSTWLSAFQRFSRRPALAIPRVAVNVSDYGEQLSDNLRRFLEMMEEHRIAYRRLPNKVWFGLGRFEPLALEPEAMRRYRVAHLQGRRKVDPTCVACGQLSDCLPDNIDAYAETLLTRIDSPA